MRKVAIEMNEVAVIIPAYNAERTIARSISSVLASTIPVDVIVVDDGSSDSTGKIADNYAKECPRVRVVHQLNAGAYSARLTGVEKCDAKYLAFVDADDMVEPGMYEEMLKFAKLHDLDIVQCECVGSRRLADGDELFMTRQEVLEKVIHPRLIMGRDAVSVWDKLYRRSVLRLPFEQSDIMMFEDLAFNLQAFLFVQKVGYLRRGLYRYNVNDGSSVRNFKMKNVADLKEAIRFRDLFIPKYGMIVPDGMLDNWICMNVLNMWKVACTAPIRDGVPRNDKIRALLDLPEVAHAFEATGRSLARSVMRNCFAVAFSGLVRRIKGFVAG